MSEIKVEILTHLFMKETYMVTTMYLYVSGHWYCHNGNKNVKETILKIASTPSKKQQHNKII